MTARILEAVLAAMPVPEARAANTKWPEPVPFESVPAPVFPTTAFPSYVHNYVSVVAASIDVPIDLPGVLVLGASAGAIGGKLRVHIRGDYYEPTNGYFVVALPPGERKSSAFAEVFDPFHSFERDLAQAAAPEIETARAARAAVEDELKSKAKELRKTRGDPVAAKAVETEIAELVAEREKIVVPVSPRLLADDVTPEKLVDMLAAQGGRLTIASAEGRIFEISLGAYSKNGSVSIEPLLKGHSGDPLHVDRIGRPSTYVPHPALSMTLAVQPEVLRMLATKKELRGRGLLARVAYSVPQPRVGMRDVRRAVCVPAAVRFTFRQRIERLLRLPVAAPNETPRVCLSPEALERWIDFAAALEPRLHPDKGDLAGLGDVGSKAQGLVVRLAGCLHALSVADDGFNPWDVAVSVETMNGACLLGDYFLAGAQRAFGVMSAGPVDADAVALLRWLSGRGSVDVRSIQRALYRRFRRADDVRAALKVLEERGYVRRSASERELWDVRPSE